MVTRRAAKSKGSTFERECFENLKLIYEDIDWLRNLGQPLQYDLESKQHSVAIECKRHKAFSWNELVKYMQKLQAATPNHQTHLLLCKANRQPVLVMCLSILDNSIRVMTYKDYFGVEFRKLETFK